MAMTLRNTLRKFAPTYNEKLLYKGPKNEPESQMMMMRVERRTTPIQHLNHIPEEPAPLLPNAGNLPDDLRWSSLIPIMGSPNASSMNSCESAKEPSITTLMRFLPGGIRSLGRRCSCEESLLSSRLRDGNNRALWISILIPSSNSFKISS